MTVSSPLRLACILGGALILASCGPKPTPQPQPLPPPPPPPAPIAVPLSADWREWPVAAGDWSYLRDVDGSSAHFGPPESEPYLSISCDFQTRHIELIVFGDPGKAGSGMITIYTTSGTLQWPAILDPDGYGTATATRSANDSGLDKMIFSRGRFAVEAPGAQPIAVPAWAEVARVIEDCRG
ncbi:MAG: hypothetical protein KA482_11650 [Sphingobium sp.]|nr:hypothetical protein [Sphingobium sp.]MBP8672296.1 hypothetical protein [Sphingobium sp.]MBP9159054.1 hypothetical protein [Sphingobium sp.]MCC6481259.1 hypothetical protein [Sphingomonadaceae bacterium]